MATTTKRIASSSSPHRAVLWCPPLSCSNSKRLRRSPHLTSPSTPPPPPQPLLPALSLTFSPSSMKRLLRRLSRVAASDACACTTTTTSTTGYHPLRPTTKSSSSSSPTASSKSSLCGARRLGGGARVPEGHVPVCVGEEGGPVERYAVRAELLGRPAFAALLRQAAQEYGYGHPGALRIPCPVADFRDLLVQLSAVADHHACADDDDDDAFCYYH